LDIDSHPVAFYNNRILSMIKTFQTFHACAATRRTGLAFGLLVLALASVSVGPAGCSKKTTPALQPIWTNYEINATVYALAFEGRYLWAGTESGLIKFDLEEDRIVGRYDKRSGLRSNVITTIKIDPQGNKWVGTHGGGLSKFDGKTWRTYLFPDLADPYVYDIAFDRQDRMWVANWKGVSVFDGKRWRSYSEADGLADKWVYAIGIDHKGTKWFGTERGVNSFDGKTWRTYNHDQGLGADSKTIGEFERFKVHSIYHTQERGKSVEGYNPNFVLAIAIGPDDTKWFGTWGAGLSRFDEKTRVFKNFTVKDGLAGNFISDLLFDKQGRLWVTTDGGVSVLDKGRWQKFTTKDGLVEDSVFAASLDRNGKLWFGAAGGISKLEQM
jgi:ligand-binding sensor domain-containing protein